MWIIEIDNMSIYKKDISIQTSFTFDVYIAVFGLRYHVRTQAESQGKAVTNAIYRLGQHAFPGKSKAQMRLEIMANNPVIVFELPEGWDWKKLKEI